LFAPTFNAAIVEKFAAAFKDEVMDAAYIADNRPLLDSTFRETLRLHMTSNTVRYIEAPTRVRNKILEPRNLLMIPRRQIRYVDEIWSAGHGDFDPARFFRDKSLSSHTSSRPFENGAWLCLREKFASKQILTTVAYMLDTHKTDLPSVDKKSQPFPKNKHENLTFKVSMPNTGIDPVIE
jgi:hypothetical protein